MLRRFFLLLFLPCFMASSAGEVLFSACKDGTSAYSKYFLSLENSLFELSSDSEEYFTSSLSADNFIHDGDRLSVYCEYYPGFYSVWVLTPDKVYFMEEDAMSGPGKPIVLNIHPDDKAKVRSFLKSSVRQSSARAKELTSKYVGIMMNRLNKKPAVKNTKTVSGAKQTSSSPSVAPYATISRADASYNAQSRRIVVPCNVATNCKQLRLRLYFWDIKNGKYMAGARSRQTLLHEISGPVNSSAAKSLTVDASELPAASPQKPFYFTVCVFLNSMDLKKEYDKKYLGPYRWDGSSITKYNK